MVSRNPLGGDPPIDTHQGNTDHLPSKNVVKETQRELDGLESSKQSKNERQTPNRAQDVAELKDYVRIAAPNLRYLISDSILATW